ncbi:hypothetical protein PHYSODRAFT_421085, partial [Phytophthora sojae]
NEVLLVQDQMGISCVIAMQTALQKACFEQRGDNLVIDWTHDTHNMGYHLGENITVLFCMIGGVYLIVCIIGSLVVTSATGRGIPVVDFLSLDQKAPTTTQIVEFFKRNN